AGGDAESEVGGGPLAIGGRWVEGDGQRADALVLAVVGQAEGSVAPFRVSEGAEGGGEEAANREDVLEPGGKGEGDEEFRVAVQGVVLEGEAVGEGALVTVEG